MDASASQRRNGGRRLAATGAAAALHVLLVVALISQAPAPTTPAESRTIEVLLAPPLRPPKAREPPPRAHTPSEPATPAAIPAPPPPPSVVATIPSPPAPSAPPAATDLRRALNGAFGCDRPGGPAPEDRARCGQRFAAAGDGSTRSIGVAPAQRAFFDAAADRALWWQKPFLNTAPHNGCRPRVTNQQASIPGGKGATSDWRVSIGCAMSF